MEDPSVQEQPSPEHRPTYVRPPGLEFAMGMGIFGLVFMVFFVAQTAVLMRELVRRMPEHFSSGFDLGALSDPLVLPEVQKLSMNGDVVASTAFWSGLVASVLLLFLVFLWRGKAGARSLIGIRSAPPCLYLIWIGVFALLVLGLEALAWAFPQFRTEFMEEVLGSTTNTAMLVLGVGILAPVFEELLLRGLLLGSLRFLVDRHVAVAISAGAFTLMHLQYEPLVMLMILPMGVVLGYARVNSGSIFVPILLHLLNNVISIALPTTY